MTEIVDFHVHVDELPEAGWIDPPEKIIALLDEAGIERAVAMTYRDASAASPEPIEYLAAAVAASEGRLLPFARIRPSVDSSAADLLSYAVAERGFRGLKIHSLSAGIEPSADPTVRLVQRARDLGIPTLLHCGDEMFTTPLAIELLAQRVPDAILVLGHMGGYHHGDEAIRVAQRNPGILLETSAMPYPQQILAAVSAVGSSRVLFGSDGPGARPALELAKLPSNGLSEADRAAILGGNAARILGMA